MTVVVIVVMMMMNPHRRRPHRMMMIIRIRIRIIRTMIIRMTFPLPHRIIFKRYHHSMIICGRTQPSTIIIISSSSNTRCTITLPRGSVPWWWVSWESDTTGIVIIIITRGGIMTHYARGHHHRHHEPIPMMTMTLLPLQHEYDRSSGHRSRDS